MVGPNGAKLERSGSGEGTQLSRQLRDATPKPDALTAFKLARRTFLAGEKVDMQHLLAELRVDRATLFRWVGNRDQLLAEVIWSLTEPTFHRAVAEANGTGPERIVDAITRFVRAVIDADFFVAYMRREQRRALRLLTTRATQFQHRLVAEIETFLAQEKAASGLSYPLPIHDLAYVITRIAESYVYADLITGEVPDADRAEAAFSALLGIGPGEHP
ncbi:QsdR family transcriptional regulator [Haloechinothrix salitolerans]|uniref:QsdR family transcriptional regulator n=1 Tax=Haloechinothrix salitolerans TaxID=926830 RepID=A0ABW2C018_9PSEU